MTPYLCFSASLHAAFLAFLLFVLPRVHPPKKYYAIDFMGGQSGQGPGLMQPAPAPAGGTGGAPVETKTQAPPETAPDPKKVAVKKEAAKPGQKADPKKDGTPKAPRDRGMKGGRGESAEGKGDVMGSKTGPLGGAGTALEIGGFGPGGGVQVGAAFPYQWYIRNISKRLWENWDRSNASNKECTIVFTILRDGALGQVKVEETSGDAFVDIVARRAVEGAAPFAPLPEGFQDPQLTIHMKFRIQ